MKVVNKKYMITIITILVVIEICTMFLMYKSLSNKNIELDNVGLKEIKNNDMFAIMVEQYDGTYEESETWPIEGYEYDESKSGCMDSEGNKIEGALTYDSDTNIASVETGNTAYCYLYFKLDNDISITVLTDGNEGIIPTSTGYKKELTCEGASYTFNEKYQRIELNSITPNKTKCSLSYSKIASSEYTTLKTQVENNATININGYRYNGKTPNNYVWFNNEMWRIIGSIPTCTSSGCAASQNLVKIIRNESLGGLPYDNKTSGFTGNWGSNTLYSLLNAHYYATSVSNLNGQNHTGCAGNCDYRNKGILSTSYYGKMLKKVYWNTGASSNDVTASVAYTNETATQTVAGYVGLMTASDYGYAASSSYYSTSLYSYDQKTITGTNWLINGYEWTSIMSSDYSDDVLGITAVGWLNNTSDSYYIHPVRPVVYLDPNVYVVSGSGSISDPYIIGM